MALPSYTLEEFRTQDLTILPKNQSIKVTVSELDSTIDFPVSFTRKGNNVEFLIEIDDTNKIHIFDKDGDEQPEIARALFEANAANAEPAGENNNGSEEDENNNNSNTSEEENNNNSDTSDEDENNNGGEEARRREAEEEAAAAAELTARREREKRTVEEEKQKAKVEATERLGRARKALEEAIQKKKEEEEDKKAGLLLCDARLKLLELLLTAPEDLVETKILCIEDLSDKFSIIPPTLHSQFMIARGKVHFYLTIKLEKDAGKKVVSYKMAIFDKTMTHHPELSIKISRMHFGFQDELKKAKEKGINTSKVGTGEVLIKKKKVISAPERIVVSDDTPQLKKIRENLYNAQLELMKLESNPYDINLNLPPVEGYTYLHILDENFFENKDSSTLTLLRIIPMEFIEYRNPYFLVKNEVVEYARKIFGKRATVKDYDPTYDIKDDFDRQMILMEQVRRHFFEIQMKELKKVYLKAKEATAAVKYLEILDANKEKSTVELKAIVQGLFDAAPEEKEKEVYTTIYNNIDTWVGNKSLVQDIADHSPLTTDNIEQVEHDHERLEEEEDMSKPDSAYPPSEEGMNAVTLNEVTLYQPHYHMDKTSGTYEVEKISDDSVLQYLREELLILPNYANRCARKDICKRNYTLYQIWRVCRKNMKENFRKILTNKVYDILWSPFEDRRRGQFDEKITDLRRRISNQEDAVRDGERLKAIANEFERRVSNEVTRIFNEREGIFNAYTAKVRTLRDLLETELQHNIKAIPNTTEIFCPYCAKYIADRSGAVACKFMYAGAYKAGHKHEIDSTNKTTIGKFSPNSEDYPKVPRPINGAYTSTNHSVGSITPDICSTCNGPTINHDHVNLNTGIATDTETFVHVDYCVSITDRTRGGRPNIACIREGGGGILEAAARLLAHRDYIKEKIRTNSSENRFNTKFPEMAVLADQYARIIRSKVARREAEDPTHVWERANYAIDNGHWPSEGRVEGGLYRITAHYAQPEDMLNIPEVPAPVRAAIDAEVRRRMPPPGPNRPPPGPNRPRPGPAANTNAVAIQQQLGVFIEQKSGLEAELEDAEDEQIAEITAQIEELDAQIASLRELLTKLRGGYLSRGTRKLKKHSKRKSTN